MTVPEVIGRFREYRRKNPLWGTLYLVLEQGNLDQSSIMFCWTEADRLGDREAAHLCSILISMTKTQRKKISIEGRKDEDA